MQKKHTCLDAEINMFDTANLDSKGGSKKVLGSSIQKRREVCSSLPKQELFYVKIRILLELSALIQKNLFKNSSPANKFDLSTKMFDSAAIKFGLLAKMRGSIANKFDSATQM